MCLLQHCSHRVGFDLLHNPFPHLEILRTWIRKSTDAAKKYIGSGVGVSFGIAQVSSHRDSRIQLEKWEVRPATVCESGYDMQSHRSYNVMNAHT